MVLAVVRSNQVCRRLMTVPGVGPLTALAFRTAVEDPTRFTKASLVGAYFGLPPRKYAPGETDRTGSISKCGDKMTRSLLCEAANALITRVQRWSWLKNLGVRLLEDAGKCARRLL
jgi:transposase